MNLPRWQQCMVEEELTEREAKKVNERTTEASNT
jgi:hypothetical protein